MDETPTLGHSDFDDFWLDPSRRISGCLSSVQGISEGSILLILGRKVHQHSAPLPPLTLNILESSWSLDLQRSDISHFRQAMINTLSTKWQIKCLSAKGLSHNSTTSAILSNIWGTCLCYAQPRDAVGCLNVFSGLQCGQVKVCLPHHLARHRESTHCKSQSMQICMCTYIYNVRSFIHSALWATQLCMCIYIYVYIL